jgi:Nucleotidyltransferase domain
VSLTETRRECSLNLESPIQSVIPGVKGEVLTVLARTSEPLTGNVIASLTGGRVSQTGANLALKTLVDDGLVLSRPAGRANLYTLNRDHVAADALVELTELRSRLLARLGDEIATWKLRPVSVALFGSVARRTAERRSDIDLLIIRPDGVDIDNDAWATQIMDIAVSIHAWSGNICEVLEYSQAEFADLGASGDSLVTNLLRDAVRLSGRSLRELTKVAR